jgi:ankyrin repeat protein
MHPSTFANLKGTTALMRAAQEGHVNITKLLVAANAEVNKKNKEGMNALMLASQRGHHLIVELLISNGALSDVQTAQVIYDS